MFKPNLFDNARMVLAVSAHGFDNRTKFALSYGTTIRARTQTRSFQSPRIWVGSDEGGRADIIFEASPRSADEHDFGALAGGEARRRIRQCSTVTEA